MESILRSGWTTVKQLEENIGRLVHLGRIISSVYHFLSRLRDSEKRDCNWQTIKLSDDCREDIKLMLKFLIKTTQGVNLNLIAYLLPTHVYRSDSCPIGLRGYAHLGWTWRFRIPPHLFFRASNNLLEHMASIVTVLVEILAGRLKPGDCCLSMVDSSTSEGWTCRSNFSETGEEPEQAVVRC